MKRRLPSAPLTEDDRRILQFVRWGLVNTIMDIPGSSWVYPEDKRDAYIMHALEGHKAVGAPPWLVRHGQLLGVSAFGIIYAPERDARGEITNFA